MDGGWLGEVLVVYKENGVLSEMCVWVGEEGEGGWGVFLVKGLFIYIYVKLKLYLIDLKREGGNSEFKNFCFFGLLVEIGVWVKIIYLMLWKLVE